MIRFCFGVLLQILQLCSPRKTTQKFLCGTMFLSVNQYYDIREEDTIVGHLKDCTREISSDVTTTTRIRIFAPISSALRTERDWS